MKKLILLAPLFMGGCATLFGDKADQINVVSDNQSAIYINGVSRGIGSASYAATRGDKTTITAKKKGCEQVTTQVGHTIAPVTFLDVLFWPAFIVDYAGGAMLEADPKNYTVNANCEK